MPQLVELARDWSARGVRVEAISIDLALPAEVTTVEALKAFCAHRSIDLPVIAFRGDYDALAERLKLPGGPPVSVLFGPQGELGRIEGSGTRAEYEALLARGDAARR